MVITRIMFLYGASGHAKVIIDIIKEMGLPIDGIFDDNKMVTKLNEFVVNHQWKGESPMIISIGNNKGRKMIAEKLNCQFERAIHPSAIISPSVSIDAGTVVMAGAIINSDAIIGKHCILNTGASVDHECIIGDFVHISPHATLCGNVHVGEESWIGAGAVVVPGIRIGKRCVIGAGATVINDVYDGTVVAGVPAKLLK